MPLAKDLLENHLTTIVGTLKSNKKQIPPCFLNKKKRRNICSSQFAFTYECTLVSYVPKKNRNVLLLSTLHNSQEIDQETSMKLKPEILTFYNKTKVGVDTADELKSNYIVARETHRWPMVILYCFLNIGGINSQVIYNANTEKKISRREYLRELSV